MAGPAQTAATPNQVRTDLEPSPGGRFSSAFPLWDGTGRVLTTWSICRLEEPDPANPTDPTAVIYVPCTPRASRGDESRARRGAAALRRVDVRPDDADAAADRDRRRKACSFPTLSPRSRAARRRRFPTSCRASTSTPSSRPKMPASSTSAASTISTAWRASTSRPLPTPCKRRRPIGRRVSCASRRPSRFPTRTPSISTTRRSARTSSKACAKSSAMRRSSPTAPCASRCRPTSRSRSACSTPTAGARPRGTRTGCRSCRGRS